MNKQNVEPENGTSGFPLETIVSLDIVNKIEAKSIKLPGKNDQDVRDIVRLIVEKGPDYTSTEYGDMTNHLLNCLDRVLSATDAYRDALIDALPHIECITQDQSNLITHIGEII